MLSASAGFGMTVLQLLLSIVVSGVMLANAQAAYEVSSSLANRLFGEKGPEFQQLVGKTIRSITFGVLGVALIQSVGFIEQRIGYEFFPRSVRLCFWCLLFRDQFAGYGEN